jgi:hypothetical protein
MAVIAGCSIACGETSETGFTDHGVAVPFSTHRGVIAAEGNPGEALVLIWLYDQRGCYGLLIVEPDTGRSQELATPPFLGEGMLLMRQSCPLEENCTAISAVTLWNLIRKSGHLPSSKRLCPKWR